MPSPFESAFDALLPALHAIAARPAVYRGTRSGTEKTLEVAVAWGETDVMLYAENVGGLTTESRDAIIEDHARLLERFGLPEPGDTIEQDGRTHEAMPLDRNRCYAWSGNRHALRIHTKLVGE